MKKTIDPMEMTRRRFLIGTGAALGAAAIMPLQAHARFLWDGKPPLRVGVILPESSLFPPMGDNLVAGIRLAFAEAGWKETMLLVEKTGGDTAVSTARRLIAGGQVDLLTGMINPLLVHRLRDDLKRSDTIFFNMEGGANSFCPRDESPHLFHNSLGYWQANWSLGRWAATAVGKRAFVASSLYEAGFDAYYAFSQGFEQAGGRVVASGVTHISPEGNELASLIAAVGKARVDFVYASYSGREAVDFVRAYGACGLAARLPLIASGFTVDEAFLPAMGEGALGIRSSHSWTPAISTPENVSFLKEYAIRNRREADLFALLGYDTGCLITKAVGAARGAGLRGEELKEALEDVVIASPRGGLRIEPGTGRTVSPLYLREVRREDGILRNAVVGELPGLEEAERMADRAAMTAHSGWTNAYLCV